MTLGYTGLWTVCILLMIGVYLFENHTKLQEIMGSDRKGGLIVQMRILYNSVICVAIFMIVITVVQLNGIRHKIAEIDNKFTTRTDEISYLVSETSASLKKLTITTKLMDEELTDLYREVTKAKKPCGRYNPGDITNPGVEPYPIAL